MQNNDEDSRQVKKDRYSDLLERVGQYKQYRDKDGVIQFKREYTTILQRNVTQVVFIIAFEDLTKEGHRLMAIDEGKESSFANSCVNSFYCFQKIN